MINELKLRTHCGVYYCVLWIRALITPALTPTELIISGVGLRNNGGMPCPPFELLIESLCTIKKSVHPNEKHENIKYLNNLISIELSRDGI